MHAAMRQLVERAAIDRLDGNAQLDRARDELVDRVARRHARERDAPHAARPGLRRRRGLRKSEPRFEVPRFRGSGRHDDVTWPASCRTTAATRSAHDRTTAIPAAGPSAAPRSIAGIARSSSGPESAAVSATRIG